MTSRLMRWFRLGPWLLPAVALAADGPSVPVREGGRVRFGLVQVDPAARTLRVPARIQITQGLLEYLLVADYGKTHESLLVTEASAYDLQAALLLLNAKPAGTNVAPARTAAGPPTSQVELQAEWVREGHLVRRPLHELVALAEADATHTVTGKLSAGPWLFTGSFISPEGFAAHFEGSYISLIRDPSAIIGNPRADSDEDDIHVACTERLPTNATPVTLEITVARNPREK